MLLAKVVIFGSLAVGLFTWAVMVVAIIVQHVKERWQR